MNNHTLVKKDNDGSTLVSAINSLPSVLVLIQISRSSVFRVSLPTPFRRDSSGARQKRKGKKKMKIWTRTNLKRNLIKLKTSIRVGLWALKLRHDHRKTGDRICKPPSSRQAFQKRFFPGKSKTESRFTFFSERRIFFRFNNEKSSDTSKLLRDCQ